MPPWTTFNKFQPWLTMMNHFIAVVTMFKRDYLLVSITNDPQGILIPVFAGINNVFFKPLWDFFPFIFRYGQSAWASMNVSFYDLFIIMHLSTTWTTAKRCYGGSLELNATVVVSPDPMQCCRSLEPMMDQSTARQRLFVGVHPVAFSPAHAAFSHHKVDLRNFQR